MMIIVRGGVCSRYEKPGRSLKRGLSLCAVISEGRKITGCFRKPPIIPRTLT